MPLLGSPLGRLLPAFSETFLVEIAVMLAFSKSTYYIPLAVLLRTQQSRHFRHILIYLVLGYLQVYIYNNTMLLCPPLHMPLVRDLGFDKWQAGVTLMNRARLDEIIVARHFSYEPSTNMEQTLKAIWVFAALREANGIRLVTTIVSADLKDATDDEVLASVRASRKSWLAQHLFQRGEVEDKEDHRVHDNNQEIEQAGVAQAIVNSKSAADDAGQSFADHCAEVKAAHAE